MQMRGARGTQRGTERHRERQIEPSKGGESTQMKVRGPTKTPRLASRGEIFRTLLKPVKKSGRHSTGGRLLIFRFATAHMCTAHCAHG